MDKESVWMVKVRLKKGRGRQMTTWDDNITKILNGEVSEGNE